MKNYFIIKSSKGIIRKKEDNSLLVFENPTQANNYLKKYFGDSPYLNIEKLKNDCS